MKDHFCPAEKEMIGFEGVCNWCGAEEKSTGWRKRQIALDKKAENARELGLDYKPVPENFMDALKYDVARRDSEFDTRIERFAELVRADEREACAKVCEDLQKKERAHWSAYGFDGSHYSAGDCAAAIRARGNT